MGVTITIDKNDLPKIAARLEPRISQVVRKVAFDIEAKAKMLAPVDTGNLKGGIQTTTDGMSAEVTAHADYAAYVEYGTKPHKITAKDGGFLRFMVGGQWVQVKEVNHPGTAAQPFMTPAAEEMRPVFIAAVTQVIRGS